MTGIELKRQTFLIDKLVYVIDSLKDTQQYEAGEDALALGINSATWSLFGVVWPTSIVMAMQIDRLDLAGKRVLYQPDHAGLVSNFIDRHSSDDVQVIIGDPNRADRARFTRNMVDLGYRHRFEHFDQLMHDGQRCKGRITHYSRKTLMADGSI